MILMVIGSDTDLQLSTFSQYIWIAMIAQNTCHSLSAVLNKKKHTSINGLLQNKRKFYSKKVCTSP